MNSRCSLQYIKNYKDSLPIKDRSFHIFCTIIVYFRCHSEFSANRFTKQVYKKEAVGSPLPPVVCRRDYFVCIFAHCDDQQCVSSCCDVRYDFHMKRCSVRLYLQLFVGGLLYYLR